MNYLMVNMERIFIRVQGKNYIYLLKQHFKRLYLLLNLIFEVLLFKIKQ